MDPSLLDLISSYVHGPDQMPRRGPTEYHYYPNPTPPDPNPGTITPDMPWWEVLIRALFGEGSA